MGFRIAMFDYGRVIHHILLLKSRATHLQQFVRWWVSAEMDEQTLHDVYLRQV